MDAVVRVTPPDLSVCLPTTVAVEESLREAWSNGSDDAGFVLGVLLSRSNRMVAAEAVWTTLAEARHPEALFALGMVDALRGDKAASEARLRDSAAAGAVLGAAAVAALET